MGPELQKTRLVISRMDSMSELWGSDMIGHLSDLKPMHLRRVTKRGEISGTSSGFRITTGLPDELSKNTSTVSYSLPTEPAGCGIRDDPGGEPRNGQGDFHGHLEHSGDISMLSRLVFLLWSGDGWSDMANSM